MNNFILIWKLALVVLVAGFAGGVCAGPDADGSGETAYRAGRFEEALLISGKAAAQGNANAQLILGLMYAAGDGVQQDDKKAIDWFLKAAALGNVHAQSNIGAMYYAGGAEIQDFKKAIIWYRKAAAQGDSQAQYGLGMIYQRGQGVEPDYVQAYKWYSLAIAPDNDAALICRLMAAEMTPAQITEAKKMVSEWKPTNL